MKVSFDIRQIYHADVVVCGGGTAGIAAAVSAARSGVRTILVEAGPYLGGIATKGLVGPFMTCTDISGKKRIIRGFFEEFVSRMIAEGGAISPDNCPGGDSRSGYRIDGHIGVTPFDAECFKRTADSLCLEAGVKLLCHTLLIGCETDGRRITAVYVTDGEGVDKINADVFIDTTGNASLIQKSGAAYFRGDEDGFVQTASMFFVIDGVDRKILDAHMGTHPDRRSRFFMEKIEAGRADGSFPCGTLTLRIFENPNGTWTVNMAQTEEPFDELRAEDITMQEISQRQQIQKIIAFLQKQIPGLENIRLVMTAPELGIRESRRMVGLHMFCLDDILNAVRFEDRIAVCANSIDIHEKVGVAYTTHTGNNYYIPLSCLISRDMDNLLAAGKCLSADKYAFAAVRVMPPCFAMGEAVGIAAAIAAARKIDVPDVPAADVQAEIIRRGGYLG